VSTRFDTKGIMEVSEKERHLIEQLREIHWGRVTIMLVDSQPDLIEEGVKRTKL